MSEQISSNLTLESILFQCQSDRNGPNYWNCNLETRAHAVDIGFTPVMMLRKNQQNMSIFSQNLEKNVQFYHLHPFFYPFATFCEHRPEQNSPLRDFLSKILPFWKIFTTIFTKFWNFSDLWDIFCEKTAKIYQLDKNTSHF